MKNNRNPKLPVKHPGIIFKERVMEPHNISLSEAAKELNISTEELSSFVAAETQVTPDLARKLEACTKVSLSFWLNQQEKYDSYTGIDSKNNLGH